MLKITTISALLLSSSLLVACGGGGESDLSKPEQNTEVNPFANGNIPTEKETYYTVGTHNGILGYTLDPQNKTVTIRTVEGQEATFSYPYDPETGIMTKPESQCQDEDDDCEVNIYENIDSLEGDGLVLLRPAKAAGEDKIILPNLIGFNPSNKANLPSGKVTYNGNMKVYTFVQPSGGDRRDLFSSGKATTQVDFDKGSLSTDFSDFEDGYIVESAKLENAEIDGAKITGGQLELNYVFGEVGEDKNVEVFGHFFGEEGQELGVDLAAFDLATRYDEATGERLGYESYEFNWIWNGTKQ